MSGSGQLAVAETCWFSDPGGIEPESQRAREPESQRAREPGQAEQSREGKQTGLQQSKLYTGTKPVESQMVILKRL